MTKEEITAFMDSEIDESIKYVGSEYIDYLKSLNVAEDWDAGFWNCKDEGKDVRYSKLFGVC